MHYTFLPESNAFKLKCEKENYSFMFLFEGNNQRLLRHSLTSVSRMGNFELYFKKNNSNIVNKSVVSTNYGVFPSLTNGISHRNDNTMKSIGFFDRSKRLQYDIQEDTAVFMLESASWFKRWSRTIKIDHSEKYYISVDIIDRFKGTEEFELMLDPDTTIHYIKESNRNISEKQKIIHSQVYNKVSYEGHKNTHVNLKIS